MNERFESLMYHAGMTAQGCWDEMDSYQREAVERFAQLIVKECKDRLVRIMGTFDLATGHADTMEQVLDALEDELRDVLGHLRARREWVGLTDEEIDECERLATIRHQSHRYSVHGQIITPADGLEWHFARAIEAKLKEKNT
jgi:lipoate-protein ligase A